MREPGTFRIVERLQRIDEDILPAQLRYHRKRVLVSKEFTFDAAHHLHCYEGKCKNLHGHTYKVVFGISGYPGKPGLPLILDISKTFGKPAWKGISTINT